MSFNNSKFPFPRQTRGIKQQAERVKVFAGTKCPCGVDVQNPTFTRANPNCPACGGWGYVYSPPVEILGIVTGYDVRRNPLDMAIIEPGDLMLATLPRERVLLATNDKCILPFYEDAEPYDGEIVVRQLPGPDLLRYAPISVQHVLSVANDGTVTTYAPGTDFTVSSNQLTWFAGHGPAPFTAYSIRYRPRFEWIIATPPNPRYARGTDIGQRVLLRRRSMVPKLPQANTPTTPLPHETPEEAQLGKTAAGQALLRLLGKS